MFCIASISFCSPPKNASSFARSNFEKRRDDSFARSSVSRRRGRTKVLFLRVRSSSSGDEEASSSSSETGEKGAEDRREGESFGKERGEDDRVSTSFTEELRKRGIRDVSGVKDDDRNNEGGFWSNVKQSAPKWAQSKSKEDDQLRKSRLLNSEAVEGLPARASELIKLFFSSTLSFAPVAAVVSVVALYTWVVFGADFIHGGVKSDYASENRNNNPQDGRNYVEPEVLLREEAYDRRAPFYHTDDD